jgi:hypothetical protein
VDYIHNKGVYTDSGFKADAWKSFASTFKSKTGKDYSKSVLESKLSDLKKKYVTLMSILKISGMGFKSATGLPFGSDALVEQYCAAHPKSSFAFTTKLDNLTLLEEIFAGKVCIFLNTTIY